MIKRTRTVSVGGMLAGVLGVCMACGSTTDGDDLPEDVGVGGGWPSGTGGLASAGKGQGGSSATGGSGGSGGVTGGTGGAVTSGGSGGVNAAGAGTGGTTGGLGGVSSTGGANATGGAAGSLGGGSGAAGDGTGGSLGSGGAAGSGGNATGGAGGMPGGSGGGAGIGGSSGKGGAGAGGAAGKGGGGNAGTGGGAGMAGGGSTSCTPWPSANGSQSVSATIAVSGTYDGMMKRFAGSGPLGSSGQDEDQDPLFKIANGGTLKNVILGNPAADGVHCDGACTLENVWWEDVGEDAATFRGSSNSQTMTVRCGGAKNADDKVFQHNGAGTLTIQDFTVETFGKLYRSCGNCSTQYGRHVVIKNVTARSGGTLVGLNTNYGDTADFDFITTYGNVTICERFTGNNTGAEPVKTGSGPDAQYCRYQDSDITRR
jgi:pectate lyase